MTRNEGFTLVELMLVVVIIGVLSAVAIPAFSRYVKKSKTTEAIMHLDKMWTGAVTFYEAERTDSLGVVLPKQFPGDGSGCGFICAWNPASGCSTRKKCPQNFFALTSSCYAWVRTGYSLNGDFAYSPNFYAFASGGVAHSVQAIVQGDLDCDGVESYYELKGSVHSTWNNSTTPKVDPWRSAVRVLNALE